MEKVKIGSRQLMIMVAIFAIGTTILVGPAIVASKARHDAWISSLLSIGIGLLMIRLYTYIIGLYPQKNIFEINDIILGKWLGTIASAFVIFMCTISLSQVIWSIGNFLIAKILVGTPFFALNAIYIMVVIYGIKLGIETIARSAEIVFPVVILLFMLVILLILPQSKYENIQPFFEYGIRPVINGAIVEISVICLPMIIFLSIPYTSVGSLSEYKKSFYIGYLIGGIIIFTTVLFCILVFGYKITSEIQFPTYSLAKKINILDFLQRLEVVIAGIWIVSIFYRASFYMYAALQGLSHIFKLKDHKYLAIPFGILSLGLSIIAYPNTAAEYELNSSTRVFLLMVHGLILPLILLVVGSIKKKINTRSN